jgi:DNA-binding NarL/FixJ family response regulator
VRNQNDKIRVVIADDHAVTRAGLILTLQQYYSARFEVVGEADSGYKALDLCLRLKPDILILDWRMPGKWDGYAILRLLRQKGIPIKIMLLTGYDDFAGTFVAPFSPDACMLKGSSTDDIVACLEQLMTEAKDFSPTSNKLFREKHLLLTPQQLTVLRLINRGLTDREISEELHITEGTVGVHLNHIYTKLGIGSRREAREFVRANRLFETD